VLAPTRTTLATFPKLTALGCVTRSCPLASDSTIGPHRFFAGTWVTFDEAGRLRAAWLIRDTELAGHVCKGTGYKGFSVRFRADESLEHCFLAHDAEIDGVPCLHGSFYTELRGRGRSMATFHPDGNLSGCQLSRDFVRHGKHYRKWQRVTRRLDGTIEPANHT